MALIVNIDSKSLGAYVRIDVLLRTNGTGMVTILFGPFHHSFAPCKGIQDSLGFWIPCCGFRIPVLDSGFKHSGFRIPKRAGFPFFPGFNAFLRTLFSCSNLATLKDVVRRHKKFVFFFNLQNYWKKCMTVP